MPRRRGRSHGPFRSKAQWRAMHARYGHRGWVKRWSHQNQRKRPYKSLPKRVRRRRRRR